MDCPIEYANPVSIDSKNIISFILGTDIIWTVDVLYFSEIPDVPEEPFIPDDPEVPLIPFIPVEPCDPDKFNKLP
jgi:hypothetical protein